MKILLTLLLLSTSLYAQTPQELTLYFVPSPVGMDWSSPKNLAWSALKNRLSFKPRFMGHVFVELKCGGVHELTGMTGVNFDYLNQLMVEQRGLGIFYHSFEGGLEDKEKVQPELNDYLKTGYANFTRFLLNDGQCKRLTQYLNEYREKNVGRHYGLANRPRFGEGAGCSAFGASFPDVIDALDQEMKESWSQTVLIPLEYAGPPLRDETVGLLRVMLNAGSWASDKAKEKVALHFWDPDKMYAWVKQKVAKKEATYPIMKVENTEGVVIDKSHFPVVKKPIWLQHTDPTYKQTKTN